MTRPFYLCPALVAGFFIFGLRDNLPSARGNSMSAEKILDKIIRGTSDANVPFEAMRRLLRKLGFNERIRGSQHILWKEGVAEILNLQPKGNKAKPYQVKQVRHVILKYRLGVEPDAEAEI